MSINGGNKCIHNQRKCLSFGEYQESYGKVNISYRKPKIFFGTESESCDKKIGRGAEEYE